MKYFLVIILVITGVLSLPGISHAVSAKDIVLKGNNRGAIACASCHGAQGEGNPRANYPALAGQPEAYLIKQLNDFSASKRENVIMQNFATALSAEEKQAVSAYYAMMPSSTRNKMPADKIITGMAEEIFYKGKWNQGIPACIQCHGSKGQGVAPYFPAIAGQHSGYIAIQLHLWKQGIRKNDPQGLMKSIVQPLSNVEIKALADYISALSITGQSR